MGSVTLDDQHVQDSTDAINESVEESNAIASDSNNIIQEQLSAILMCLGLIASRLEEAFNTGIEMEDVYSDTEELE